MRLGKLGKIESIPDKQARAHGADNLFFDSKNGRIVATDGHCMVVATVEPGPDDTTGYIPAEAMKYAREVSAKAYTADAVEITVNGCIRVQDKVNRSSREFHRPEGSTFPAYSSLVPKVSGPPTCTFDYALLKKVIDALGDADLSGAPKSLAIWVTDGRSPIVVKTTSDGPIGIIMPVKMSTEGWALSVEEVEERAVEARKPKVPKIPKAKVEKVAKPRGEVVSIAGPVPPATPDNPEPGEQEGDGPQAA